LFIIFSTVINGIEQVANENGYSVIICLSDDSFDKEVLNMEMLLMEALIHNVPLKKLNLKVISSYREVIDQGMPVVMFDRVTNEILMTKSLS
jgi:LacI family transcriptional regulator